jgi:hypothetical protein
MSPPSGGGLPRRLRLARGRLVQRVDEGTECVGQDLHVAFQSFDPRLDRWLDRVTRG